MKISNLPLIICFSLFLSMGFAQAPFITKWKTDNPGSGCDRCIEIPTVGTGYNFQVDWGDGLGYDTTMFSGNAFHQYEIPGVYEIQIKGDFPRIYFYIPNNEPPNSAHKIIDILSWGDIEWTSMSEAFYNCDSLTISATDAPDLMGVASTYYMFYNCGKLNSNLNNWEVSSIENMSRMFSKATSFNGDISNWDVSNVKNMSGMFSNAISFMGNINDWDVSSVESMSQMFWNTETDFILSDWDVSSVTNMSGMFYQNPNFTGSIEGWDVSNVTRTDFMFRGCSSFAADLSEWDVSKVEDMRVMFEGCSSFSCDLSQWNVSSVNNIGSLFDGCTIFESDLSQWDISNVTSLQNLFFRAEAFNSDLSNWDVSNVTNMNSTFRNARSFNMDLNSWDVSNVTSMKAMFLLADSFNGNISDWDVSNVTDMESMFELTNSFNGDINNWNVSNVTNLIEMFHVATAFDQSLESWDLSSVQDSLGRVLQGCGMSTENYENTLNGWSDNSSTPDNVILESGNLTYCNEYGRNRLLDKGWDIREDRKLTTDEGCFWVSTADLEITSSIIQAVFPNPTNQELILNTNTEVESFRIVNSAGQVIFSQQISETNTVIDVSRFTSGIYILECFSRDQNEITRFIKL